MYEKHLEPCLAHPRCLIMPGVIIIITLLLLLVQHSQLIFSECSLRTKHALGIEEKNSK